MHVEHLDDHETQTVRSSEMDQAPRVFRLVQDDFNPDDPYETRIAGYGLQIGSPVSPDRIAFCLLYGERIGDVAGWVHADSANGIAERYHGGIPTQVEWIDSNGKPI